MIKAISRQVLEVVDTGNMYFDKAWLLVSPEFSMSGADRLNAEAADYLIGLDPPSYIKKKRGRLARFLSFAAAAWFGGLVAAALLQLY